MNYINNITEMCVCNLMTYFILLYSCRHVFFIYQPTLLYLWASCRDWSRGWMGWLATHHEFCSFMRFSWNCLQIYSVRRTIFKFFPGGMFQTPSKSILSVLHTLCKLSQHCINPPHFKFCLKPKPATLLELFLDQCLSLQPRTMATYSGQKYNT